MTSPRAKTSEPPPPVVMDVPYRSRFDPLAAAALRARFVEAQRRRAWLMAASVAIALLGLGVVGKLATAPEPIVSAPPTAAAATQAPPESDAPAPIAKAPETPAPSATVPAPSSTASSRSAKAIAPKAPKAKSAKRR
jgi:hypothetical protein